MSDGRLQLLCRVATRQLVHRTLVAIFPAAAVSLAIDDTVGIETRRLMFQ